VTADSLQDESLEARHSVRKSMIKTEFVDPQKIASRNLINNTVNEEISSNNNLEILHNVPTTTEASRMHLVRTQELSTGIVKVRSPDDQEPFARYEADHSNDQDSSYQPQFMKTTTTQQMFVQNKEIFEEEQSNTRANRHENEEQNDGIVKFGNNDAKSLLDESFSNY